MHNVLVVGSIGFDIIFAIHGNIKDELPLAKGKLDHINLMFTAKNKEQYYGGTGGNIAYGLGQLGSKPILFSVAGKDFFTDYAVHLKSNNVDLRVYNPKETLYSAVFYGISDEKHQQIGIWQPNAYGDHIEETKLEETVSQKDFESIKIAVFSPGTGISTRNHMLETHKRTNGKAMLIFDPSQVLSIFYEKALLRECLSLSNIVISNEIEIAQFKSLFNLSVKDILDMGVDYVIETLGERGSIVHSKTGKKKISAVKPKRVLETTGAGDAFRAGLIYGILQEKSIPEACEIGARIASKSVEEFGGQGYVLDEIGTL